MGAAVDPADECSRHQDNQPIHNRPARPHKHRHQFPVRAARDHQLAHKAWGQDRRDHQLCRLWYWDQSWASRRAGSGQCEHRRDEVLVSVRLLVAEQGHWPRSHQQALLQRRSGRAKYVWLSSGATSHFGALWKRFSSVGAGWKRLSRCQTEV